MDLFKMKPEDDTEALLLGMFYACIAVLFIAAIGGVGFIVYSVLKKI